MVAGVKGECVAGRVVFRLFHLLSHIVRREEFQHEFIRQIHRLDMTVGKTAVVVALRQFLDGERAETLHGDTAILSLAEHIAHLIEERRDDNLTSGYADATAFRHRLREFVEVFFGFHISITGVQVAKSYQMAACAFFTLCGEEECKEKRHHSRMLRMVFSF